MSLAWATLVLLPAISTWTDGTNRFFYFWQRSDGLALIVSILILAACGYLLYLAERRLASRALTRIGAVLFVLTLIDGVLGYMLSDNKVNHDGRDALVWAAVSALALAAMAYTRWRLVNLATKACLFMVPLTAIVAVQVLSWPSWDTRTGQLDPHPIETEGPHPPVFLFIFDEWSARRSTQSGQFLPFFKNLGELAAHATVYTHALSDGMDTEISLPRILYSQMGRLQAGGGAQVLWQAKESRSAVADVPNIFQLARHKGYTTAMLGYYLPYRVLLGDAVDYVVTYPHVPKSERLMGKVLLTLLSGETLLPDPVNRTIGRRVSAQVYSRNWVGLNHELRDRFRAVLKSARERSFVIVHFPLPHAPFVYNPDGSYRGPFRGEILEGSAADYERSLRYLDVVIGDFVNDLKRAGVYDSALVILTSDHSWRLDPDSAVRSTPDAFRRVPLLVKWPGEGAGVIDRPFCLSGLREVIARALDESPGTTAPCTTGWQVQGH